MKLYMYIKDKIGLVVDRDKPKKLYFALWFMVLGHLWGDWEGWGG